MGSAATDLHNYCSTPFFHLVGSNSTTSIGGGAGGADGCSSAVLIERA
jgi:hypothetical protein